MGADEALVAELLARADRYGMKTQATDWTKVTSTVARNQKATAGLARAVGDQPLRPIRPRGE